MSKRDSKTYNRPLGAKAYAAIAEVEGVRLTEAGRKRLAKTKNLPQEGRRAEILRAYKADKTTRT